MKRETIFDEIRWERERQIDLAHGGDTNAFDTENTDADWATFICYYACRNNPRLLKSYNDFRGDMIKVAALAVAAIESTDAKAEVR